MSSCKETDTVNEMFQAFYFYKVKQTYQITNCLNAELIDHYAIPRDFPPKNNLAL